AIKRLAIRGAPLIGVAAAYGVALELARDADALERACEMLATARPTAANLAYAVRRVQAAVTSATGEPPAGAVLAELADRGSLELVLATESRPLLQGARLTVYELGRLGIAHQLLVDGAAA